MQSVYRAILWLYPAEYRATFADEMIEAFEQAKADSRKRGMLHLLAFAICELAGLVKGLFTERAVKLAAPEAYISSRSAPRQNTDVPVEIHDVQRHLEHLIRSMEHAIAYHDFPKARLYSNEERTTRALLQRLQRSQGSA